MESLYVVGFAVLAVIAFILIIIFLKFFTTWVRARVASAPVSIGKMVGMSLRKVPVGLIVDNRITAVKAGIDIASDPLEAHYLAGGDVMCVIFGNSERASSLRGCAAIFYVGGPDENRERIWSSTRRDY